MRSTGTKARVRRYGSMGLGFDRDGRRLRQKVSGKTKTEVKDKLKETALRPRDGSADLRQRQMAVDLSAPGASADSSRVLGKLASDAYDLESRRRTRARLDRGGAIGPRGSAWKFMAMATTCI
jgi:hypothetical protein